MSCWALFQTQVHIHLVNRETGEVSGKTYVSNPFFYFHTINAFQKGSAIILDLVVYKDADVSKNIIYKIQVWKPE